MKSNEPATVEQIEAMRPGLLERLKAEDPMERLEAVASLHTLDIGLLLRLVDQLVSQVNELTGAAVRAGFLVDAGEPVESPLPHSGGYL